MKDNLKHSLIKLKSKLNIRKPMARVGGIKCYSNDEYSYYLNKAMDKVLGENEPRVSG